MGVLDSIAGASRKRLGSGIRTGERKKIIVACFWWSVLNWEILGAKLLAQCHTNLKATHANEATVQLFVLQHYLGALTDARLMLRLRCRAATVSAAQWDGSLGVGKALLPERVFLANSSLPTKAPSSEATFYWQNCIATRDVASRNAHLQSAVTEVQHAGKPVLTVVLNRNVCPVTHCC